MCSTCKADLDWTRPENAWSLYRLSHLLAIGGYANKFRLIPVVKLKAHFLVVADCFPYGINK